MCAQAAQNHTVRGRTLRLAKSRLRRLLAGRPLWWVCSPYGSAGADEFTNGVPRSYLRALSLAALPQQSESTTGRAGRRVAVRLGDCTSQSRQARAQLEGKNRLSDSEINLHRPFVTIYCHLRRYPVGAHSVRPSSAKSYGSWANNVRPCGIDCTDRKIFP